MIVPAAIDRGFVELFKGMHRATSYYVELLQTERDVTPRSMG